MNHTTQGGGRCGPGSKTNSNETGLMLKFPKERERKKPRLEGVADVVILKKRVGSKNGHPGDYLGGAGNREFTIRKGGNAKRKMGGPGENQASGPGVIITDSGCGKNGTL